jgi:hypothetical protein
VIADEDRGVERGVEAAHHRQRPRPRADDLHVGRELLDEQVLAVAMRVGDDDLGSAGFLRRGYRRHRLGGHELAEAAVPEPGRPELIARDHAGDALHVHRDVHLQPARLGLRRLNRQAREDDDGGDDAMHGALRDEKDVFASR